MDELGFVSEKRGYKPHITIAQDVALKVHGLNNNNMNNVSCSIVEPLFENLKNIFNKLTFPDIIIDRITLYKSEQIEDKRVYTSIGDYMLKEKQRVRGFL